MQLFSETKKWLNVAKGLESVGLISSSDWKTVKVLGKDYRNHLIQKVIDNAAHIGTSK